MLQTWTVLLQMNKYKLIFLSLLLFFISSCNSNDELNKIREDGHKLFPKREDSWFRNPSDKIDPYGNLSRDDYMNGLANNTGEYKSQQNSSEAPKIKSPELSNLIESPEKQNLISDKLVSISVGEDTPIKDVIIELARRAEVDVEVDKDISGSIIFIAKDKPFSEVIDRICKIVNLTYSYNDGILKISRDMPVIKNYKFNMIDLTRTSQSAVNANFSVGGTSSGNSSSSSSSSSGSSAANTGGTITGGSSLTLNAKSGDGDIWTNITVGINQILSKYDFQSGGNPSIIAASNQNAAQQIANSSNTGSSGIISVNKNAGLITVLATEKQHKAVKEYLDRMHIELASQVLIEAKVVEVTLSDEYQSGINWNLLMNDKRFGLGGGFGADPVGSSISSVASDYGLKLSVLPGLIGDNNNSIDSSIKLLQTFGTTRSLSNPRISALNNQFAVLNFSKNEVYFTIQEDITSATTTGSSTTDGQTAITSTINTVPIGVVLSLQPSIDLEKNEIIMNLRPTLTRVTDRVDDPGAKIIAQKNSVVNLDSFKSQIPIVDTREIDTTLRVKNGDIMVIGGLLQDNSENTDQGIPGVSTTPILGNLFKSVNKTQNNVETVIFIKATIIPGNGVSVEDEEFYKKFTTSRSPFFPTDK